MIRKTFSPKFEGMQRRIKKLDSFFFKKISSNKYYLAKHLQFFLCKYDIVKRFHIISFLFFFSHPYIVKQWKFNFFLPYLKKKKRLSSKLNPSHDKKDYFIFFGKFTCLSKWEKKMFSNIYHARIISPSFNQPVFTIFTLQSLKKLIICFEFFSNSNTSNGICSIHQ